MKKKKIKWIGGLLALCLMAEPGAVAMAKAESEVQETELESEVSVNTDISEAESDKEDKAADGETEIQPGERTATIVVTSITGNELTYYEVEDETETEAESESQEPETSADADKKTVVVKKDTQTDDVETEGAEGESVQKDGSMTPPDGMQQGDGMPQGDSRMTSPDGMPQMDGNVAPPDGSSQGNTDSSGMPEDMPSGAFRKGDRSEQQDTKNVYLPVPVVVHTDTDEKRTFSILEAGDRLQVTIVTDEEGNETITEIWMLKE